MADIEINIGADSSDAETCDCCPDCKMSSGNMAMGAATEPAEPTVSKDALLAKLKELLGNNTANGRAERQTQIDDLIDALNDIDDEED